MTILTSILSIICWILGICFALSALLVVVILLYFAYFFRRDKQVWNTIEECANHHLDDVDICDTLIEEYNMAPSTAMAAVTAYRFNDKNYFKRFINGNV